MCYGRKRILRPFTGREKQKAWKKTRGKRMLVKRRPYLTETDRDHITVRNG